MNQKFVLLFASFTGVVGLIYYAPFYLTYSDSPMKSDVIVLLLGPNIEAREKEAERLITDGFSKHLIIPERGDFFKSSKSGRLVLLRHGILSQNKLVTKKTGARYLENTHLEMSCAKVMIDRSGFKSAIFVSSPYHMRRVKLIADSVFTGRDYHLLFVPTRYEQADQGLWWLHKYDFRRVASEYAKIVWFRLYEVFQ